MEKEMLKGKVAIITGASYGMGQTMAELFAEEGAAVVLTARGKEKLDRVVEGICAKGGRAVGVVADVCSTEDTKRVFETALREFGDVDILINNAGIVNTDDFAQLSLADWNRVLAVDLTAVFLTSQVLFRHMERIGGGRIVNVASIAGKVGGGYLGTAAYAAAKAGVISLTKSIAKAGSSKNIYCNSLCPAYTKTPLVSILTGEKEQKVLDAMSLHRAADPMEVASAVLFLASDAASFVQGENLNCDGGMLMNG